MADAAIAPNFLQAPNAHADLPPQVSFDAVLAFDDFPKTVYRRLGQIANPRIRIHSGLFQDLAAAGQANPKDTE